MLSGPGWMTRGQFYACKHANWSSGDTVGREKYLSECYLLTPAKERIGIVQQRLNLLLDRLDPLDGLGLLFFIDGGTNYSVQVCVDLGEICVNKEIDPVAK